MSTEQALMSDSKYRAYVSVMEKALKAFEYTHEWADLISALTKINKVSDAVTQSSSPLQ